MRLGRGVLLIVTGLAIAGTSSQANNSKLRIEVTPRVSAAPAAVRVRAIVAPSGDNRSLRIVADSGDYYTSSVVGLDGKDASTVTETVLKNLPGGRYDIVVA